MTSTYLDCCRGVQRHVGDRGLFRLVYSARFLGTFLLFPSFILVPVMLLLGLCRSPTTWTHHTQFAWSVSWSACRSSPGCTFLWRFGVDQSGDKFRCLCLPSLLRGRAGLENQLHISATLPGSAVFLVVRARVVREGHPPGLLPIFSSLSFDGRWSLAVGASSYDLCVAVDISFLHLDHLMRILTVVMSLT